MYSRQKQTLFFGIYIPGYLFTPIFLFKRTMCVLNPLLYSNSPKSVFIEISCITCTVLVINTLKYYQVVKCIPINKLFNIIAFPNWIISIIFMTQLLFIPKNVKIFEAQISSKLSSIIG